MKIKIIFLTSINIFLLLPSFATAQIASTTASTTIVSSTNINNVQTSASSTPATAAGLQAPAIPPLLAAVKSAKLQLASVTLNHALSPIYKNFKNKKTGKVTKSLTGYSLSAKDIALAILDPSTNQIKIIKGMQTGSAMKFSDPSADVSLIKFNGVNSKFQIKNPTGGIIVALKYLISGPETGGKKTIESALSEAIYVPSSTDLHSPDIIAYGENYLNNLLRQTSNDLANIPSQAYPGKMLTDAIPPSLVKALIYAEHTDTSTILNGDSTAVQDTISSMDILLATNENDTYKYSVSTAGARGIAQFMPATYQGLVVRHPEAGLISDFVTGMSDHKNSIKAMYLLLDDYAGAVRAKAPSGFTEGQVFDYGAASYNGGVTRVVKALNSFGVNWNQDNSSQISALQSQVNNFTSQVKSLKSQVTKAKDKKTKAQLQSQLNTAKNSLADFSSQLDTAKSASLKNETVNYLKKIYKVVQIFNGQQI